MKRMESPSSINTFKQCKRKYYYSYIQKLPGLSNIHQIRGNIAHSALENFYNLEIDDFTENTYRDNFQKAIQQLLLHHWKLERARLKELKLSKDQEQFYFEETMLMLMNWINQFLEQLKTVMEKKQISVQEAFLELTPIREQKYVSDNYSIQGFIDAIHQIENEVHLIDYKTNARFEIKDSIKLQLAIYSLLYFEKHGQKPSKVGIFFLRQRMKLINVEEELLELARKEIELVHRHTSLTEDIQDYPPTVTGLCKWSTGKCDFYDVCKPHE